MRNTIFLIVLLTFSVLGAIAQTPNVRPTPVPLPAVPANTDKREIAFYGTYIRGDVTLTDVQHPQFSRDETRDSVGGMIEGSHYFNDGPVAFTVAFSHNVGGNNTKLTVGTMGVTLKANRHGTIQPFVTAGFGVSAQNNFEQPANRQFFQQNLGVGGAVNAGVGIEIKASRRVGIVPVRVDYVRTDMFHTAVPARDNVRLAVGLIFHF
jgi:hypothetical protein